MRARQTTGCRYTVRASFFEEQPTCAQRARSEGRATAAFFAVAPLLLEPFFFFSSAGAGADAAGAVSAGLSQRAHMAASGSRSRWSMAVPMATPPSAEATGLRRMMRRAIFEQKYTATTA